MDTPLRQAIRTAFDSPTLANIEAVARAAPGAAVVSREAELIATWRERANALRTTPSADGADAVIGCLMYCADELEELSAAVSPLAMEELTADDVYNALEPFIVHSDPSGDTFELVKRAGDYETLLSRLRAGRHA